MIRQEPILAALRRPRAPKGTDRQARIAQYRDKAKELRAMCEDVILEQTRLTLLRLAESYERLASGLELAAPKSLAQPSAETAALMVSPIPV